MKIIDAIKALKGDYAAEKEAHITTMTERDEASAALQPTKDALAAAEAVIAEAAEALGIEAEPVNTTTDPTLTAPPTVAKK